MPRWRWTEKLAASLGCLSDDISCGAQLMAVKLSSDLVADVMRNADPLRQAKAMARLKTLDSPNAASFAGALHGLGKSEQAATGLPGGASGTISAQTNLEKTRKGDAYTGFERVVLKNLFETLLPDEKSGAFGGGPSAGVWRSLAADQLAGVYSASGGVGIASMLNTAEAKDIPRKEAQWPYFSLNSIKTFTG